MRYDNRNTDLILTSSEVKKAVYPSTLPKMFTGENIIPKNIYPIRVITPAIAEYQKVIQNNDLVRGETESVITYTVEDIPVDEAKDSKLAEVDTLHKQHLYTDIEATFPSGMATIQFRDETDRTNLSNVAAGAMACLIAGTPETVMQYRTKDDVIQQVPAGTMMQIAMDILATKQAVVDNAWMHKDAIKALTDIRSIIDYDITTGW